MKFWWITDPTRLEHEKAAVEALAAEVSWFTLSTWKIDGGRLSMEGELVAHGHIYPFQLLYPDRFPWVPAWVVPQDPDVRWSNHQYGAGGTLCLELRPDNWDPNATGADVLKSAYNLLDQENPLGKGEKQTVPSAHLVNDIQRYDWKQHPILISKACYTRLQAGVHDDVAAIRWSVEDDVWPIMVTDSADRARTEHPASFDLGTWRVTVKVLVTKNAAPKEVDGTREEFADAIGVSLEGIGTEEGVVFVCGTDELAAFHSPKNHGVYPRKWIVLNSAFGERSGHGDVLSAMTVGIVGVGSIGSKLAETLLRSGVRDFVLADGDVFLPENLERHVLDWRDVGFRKVHAMKRRLLQIYNGANVLVVDSNLNWQLSASYQATIVDCFSDCDLLIDASGDEATSRFLGALADYNKTPFLSAKVFEGGFGCLIARAVPEIDANYSDGYGAYVAFCNEQDKVPPSTGHRPYEAISEEGAPVVADDAAVTIASGHAARVAIDILDPEVSLGPNAWLLVGLKKEWIFGGHGHNWQLDVGGPTKAADRLEPDLGLTEFQRELLEGVSSETNDTP